MIKTSDQDAKLKRKSLVLATLFTGASAFALMSATPAMAQEADAETTDEVVATGIRQSLKGAQDIKRNADTFVDAVSAEDIGALPDRSVTEALQRVPGITISRFAAADDPDHFSVEGSDVVVRGLTYVSAEFNGRSTFSSNNGRSLSFADVPSELLQSVQVFKNQTADLIEGGIAGSINLVTRKAFDAPGLLIAGAAEINYGDMRKQGGPTISGLISNRWDTDIGEFGILLNGVTSKLYSRSDGTQISSYQPRDDLAAGRVWVPEGAVVKSQDFDRARTGFGGSVQWRSPDKTIEATAEYLRSEATTSWVEHVSEIATDNIGDTAFYALPGTSFDFNSDSLFSNGSISAPKGWRADQQGTDPRTPVYGLQSNNIKRGVEQEYQTSDTSFNLKYTPNDTWSFNFDYQHVDSTVQNVDMTLWGTTFQDMIINIPSDGSIPDIQYLAPNITGDGTATNPALDCSNGFNGGCPSYFSGTHNSFADPYNSFWRAAMDHIEDSEGQQDAFRADVQYNFNNDDSWMKSVRVGARLSDREQTTRSTTYNWGALSEIWGNGGPVWMDEVGAPQHALETFTWDNFQRGESTQPPAMPFYALNPAQNYDTAADFADSVVAQWLANGGNTGGAQGGGGGWRRLGDRPGLVPGTVYLPSEINTTPEKTKAIYAKLDFGQDDPFGNGITVNGNFGVRYVNTRISSTGAFQFPDVSVLPIHQGNAVIQDPLDPNFGGENYQNRCLAPIPDPAAAVNPTPYTAPAFCSLSAGEQAAARAFANGASVLSTVENEYNNWLPSFNVKFGLSEDKIIRFGYSKGITRPDLGLHRNYFTISPITDADDPRTLAVEAEQTGFDGGWHGWQSSGGNPFLEPITAHNFDVSYEWYFAEVGSLTATAFYKSISNIVLTGFGDLTFDNAGAVENNVFTRQPTNSDETGKIKGFEVTYQQFYDQLPGLLSGLGVQANYTFIDSDGVQSGGVSNSSATPASNSATVDLAELPLQGLSKHNANAALIYEKGRISSRLAYNWRSDYLVTPRDVITPFYPVFQPSSGQLDGSFYYSLSDNLKIGVQAANLLDTVTRTESFIPNSDGRRGPRSYFRNDRRVTFSVRGKF